VNLARVQAENIARQVKSADLAAAVTERIAGAYATGHDLVEIVRRFAFAEYFRVAGKGARGPLEIESSGGGRRYGESGLAPPAFAGRHGADGH